MSSHKLIRIYMGGLILGVNTLCRFFCFFKLFPMVDKGLNCAVLPTIIGLTPYGKSPYANGIESLAIYLSEGHRLPQPETCSDDM